MSYYAFISHFSQSLEYFAPTGTFTLVSVALQLVFIVLLASFWLVEFGLLKANQQVSEIKR
jgi:hypothetical protein